MQQPRMLPTLLLFRDPSFTGTTRLSDKLVSDGDEQFFDQAPPPPPPATLMRVRSLTWSLLVQIY